MIEAEVDEARGREPRPSGCESRRSLPGCISIEDCSVRDRVAAGASPVTPTFLAPRTGSAPRPSFAPACRPDTTGRWGRFIEARGLGSRVHVRSGSWCRQALFRPRRPTWQESPASEPGQCEFESHRGHDAPVDQRQSQRAQTSRSAGSTPARGTTRCHVAVDQLAESVAREAAQWRFESSRRHELAHTVWADGARRPARALSRTPAKGNDRT